MRYAHRNRRISIAQTGLPTRNIHFKPMTETQITNTDFEASAGSTSPIGAEDTLKPFIVESLAPPIAGPFRPTAVVQLTTALRTSGLLHKLPGEDMKNLLFVLTFVHPNGWCQPTVFELAHAMRVSQSKARDRLGRLASFEWQGKPLLTELKRESGMDGYAPSPLIVGHTLGEVPEDVSAEPVFRAAGRDAVIAYSREHYARPRAQVEREMAIQMGWPLPEEIEARHATKLVVDEDPERAGARRRLLGMNVPHVEVERLLSTYPIGRILQQLLWLPYRNAKSKARLIVAAIDEDYDEPRHVA